MRHELTHGFTLVELMIAVVIVGILAGIAYPSYQTYMIQTRRTDGQIALMQAANQQERFFTECNYYAQTLAGARDCGADSTAGILAITSSSPDGHYAITLVAPTTSGGICPITSCYILEANPGVTGRQANNGRLRITSKGEKTWDKANTNTPNANGNFVNKWTDK